MPSPARERVPRDGAVSSNAGGGALGQAALQLGGRDRCRLVVSNKLETELVSVNCDTQPRRAFWQIEHLPKRRLGEFVVSAAEAKQHASSSFGNQG